MKQEKENIQYLPIGLALGVAFGVIFDNLGLFLSLGLLFGVALSKYKDSK